MEKFIGLAIFLAVAGGAGYFVYTRIMAKKAEKAARMASKNSVEPPKESV